MSRAEKVTIRFGLRRFNGAALQRTDGGQFGMADPHLTRAHAIIPPNPASWSFALSAAFGAEVCGVPLQIPRRAHTNDGPVTAISIAGDSAIESVDLYFAGKSEHAFRVAPGCPFVGEVEDNTQVLVVPNRPMPQICRRDQIVAPTSPADDTETCFWDMPGAFQNGIPIGQVPCRLILHRGIDGADAAAAITQRARYTATAAWQVRDRGGAVPTVPTLVMVVDGRRRIRVEASAWNGNAPGASLQVYGAVGHTSMIANLLSSQIDVPAWDELLAPVVLDAGVQSESIAQIFDYQGNPYYMVEARIVGGAIGDTGSVTIHAWDD